MDLILSMTNVLHGRTRVLGFKNNKDACCGFFGLESGLLCNLASQVCPDPAHYVFWDAYHPRGLTRS